MENWLELPAGYPGWLVNVAGALVILLLGYAVIRIVTGILKKTLKKSKLDPALHVFILNCVRIALWVVLVVMMLSALEVATAPLVTMLGAAGAAVALALKDSLGNFAGGILIILNKPFSQGDHIQTQDGEGIVEKTDLLYTTLKTFDNTMVIIPNGLLTGTAVQNYSMAQQRRVDCSFSVAYSSDLALVKETLRTVAEQDPRVLPEPEPLVWVAGQKDSAIEMALKVWCATEDYWDLKYSLEEQVKLAFDVAGIEIPFPQMDVHYRKR